MSRNILIVDDEPDMAEFVADVVVDEGLNPLVALSAKQAIKELGENQFCGIITDIVMPDMDGIELIQQIAKSSRVVPIVLMSGYNAQYAEMAKIIAEQSGLPVIGTLSKPITVDQLIKKLDLIKEAFA